MKGSPFKLKSPLLSDAKFMTSLQPPATNPKILINQNREQRQNSRAGLKAAVNAGATLGPGGLAKGGVGLAKGIFNIAKNPKNALAIGKSLFGSVKSFANKQNLVSTGAQEITSRTYDSLNKPKTNNLKHSEKTAVINDKSPVFGPEEAPTDESPFFSKQGRSERKEFRQERRAERKNKKEIRKTTKGEGRNFRTTEEGAGMTAKGVASYKAKNPGSKLSTAVTGDVKPGSKSAKRRKSFCARSKGWTCERGKAARARWKC